MKGRARVWAAVWLAALVICGTAEAGAQASPPIVVDKRIPYVDGATTKQSLDIYRQSGPATGRPSIVMVHGGGWHGGSPDDLARQARLAAQQGWVTFNLDYRSTSEMGTNGEAWPAELDDVKSGLAWVREHAREYGADPTKLALLGSSAGGMLAALAGADPSSRIITMALWSAPTDLVSLVPDDSGIPPACGSNTQCLEFWRNPWVTGLLGCTPDACPDRYAEASPITRAATMPPTYVANGTAEIVPLEQAELLSTALEQRNVPSELTVVPGARHASTYTDSTWNETMTFLARELGVPQPEPIEFHDSPFDFGPATIAVILAVVGIAVAVVARIATNRNQTRGR